MKAKWELMYRTPKKVYGLCFEHYCVIQIKSHFYGVYNRDCKSYMITHGTSLNKAIKKAKLLEYGYQEAMDVVYYSECDY